MNKFRKPYLSYIFALLLLFTSCSQHDNEIEEINDPLSFTKYVEEHIKMAIEINELMESETGIDIEFLQSSIKSIDINQLESVLKNANFIKFSEIADLLKQINTNNYQFAESNPNFNKQKIENSIINVLDKTLFIKSTNNKSSTCAERYRIAKDRCFQNSVIALSIATVSAIFTAGIGGAVGISAAFLQNLICNGQANYDYEQCIAE